MLTMEGGHVDYGGVDMVTMGGGGGHVYCVVGQTSMCVQCMIEVPRGILCRLNKKKHIVLQYKIYFILGLTHI